MARATIDIEYFRKHRGRDNAVTREQMCLDTGSCDRTVRQQVNELRKHYVICSSSNGKGYYLPESYEDIEDFIRETTNRIMSGFETLTMAKRVLKDRGQNLILSDSLIEYMREFQ